MRSKRWIFRFESLSGRNFSGCGMAKNRRKLLKRVGHSYRIRKNRFSPEIHDLAENPAFTNASVLTGVSDNLIFPQGSTVIPQWK
jgi:hypothetical protein